MGLLKKLTVAFLVSFAMMAVVPTAMAKAGKQENQTQAEVVQSLLDTITAAEAALEGIKSGADKNDVLKLLKISKQTAKTIESSVVLSDRDRALARVNKARSAFKKGKLEEAEAFMVEAVERFKKVNEKYHNF